uniref:Uncharacterized protein n=1 Tax=Timema bartmani TaxID=61472 RepID=A0A7R9EX29_9NEOP|nr:unnamed protein product [Timema bartmani]
MPSNKLNLRDRVEDGELDLSMSDLEEVPVRDIVYEAVTDTTPQRELSSQSSYYLGFSRTGVDYLKLSGILNLLSKQNQI